MTEQGALHAAGRRVLPGNRRFVRRRASQAALDLPRRRLM